MRLVLICSVSVYSLTSCDPSARTPAPAEVAPDSNEVEVGRDSGRKVHNVLNLRNLLPAKRFGEYAVGERHRAAQDDLNAGDVETAYNAFAGRNRSLDGPREKRFDDALEVAFQEWSNTTPGSNFAERVETYWLPELKALPISPPANEATCRSRKVAIEELAQNVLDGEELTLTPAQARTLVRFRQQVRAKELILLPMLKRQCG